MRFICLYNHIGRVIKSDIMKDRKKDHIDLAFQARMGAEGLDRRFSYEPLLDKHPEGDFEWVSFLGRSIRIPLWVSSMTGGTELAGRINRNLARACREFGMGMGLGSCRPLLESDQYFEDFDLRDIIGEELPFYANLGIAQVEEMVMADDVSRIVDLVKKLRADGLIIHVNPLQEWLQPEGNRFSQPPIDTIRSFIEMAPMRIIVKEVGQGMGLESLKALLQLPLEAIEFAAYGGTNFARVELLRSDESMRQYLEPIARIGHDAFEMTEIVNGIIDEGYPVACKQLIISGGIRSFLDGFYLIRKAKLPAVYGQASELLKHATGSYEELQSFIFHQVNGLKIAEAFFKLK